MGTARERHLRTAKSPNTHTVLINELIFLSLRHLIFIFRPEKTSADQTGQVNGFVSWTTLLQACFSFHLWLLFTFWEQNPNWPLVQLSKLLKLHLVRIKFWSQIHPIKSSWITANTSFPWAWKWYFWIVIPSEQKAPRYQASSLLIKHFPNSSLTPSASPLICSLCFGHAFLCPQISLFSPRHFPPWRLWSVCFKCWH